MSETENKEPILIPFKASKYDELEETLLLQTSQGVALTLLSDWLNEQLQASFVVFTDNEGKQKHTVIYEKEKDVQKTEQRIEQIIHARFSQYMPTNCLCKHPTGDVSVPYIYDKNKTGCMFLGLPKGKEITQEQIDFLFSVMAVVNKAMLFFEAIRNNREKNILKDAFAKMVSPTLVDDILSNQDSKGNTSNTEKKELSIMVSRIEEFGQISQNIEPQALIKILNLYLSEMSKIILDLGGVVGKYEGDSLVSFFGTHKKEDSAVRCCLAALRMRKLEDMLNKQMKEEGIVLKSLHIAIGINTGSVLMMNMGTKENPNYTVLGSNVTIATRIESLNKFFKTKILMSSSTYEAVCASFETKPAGKAHLNELNCEVELFELCSPMQGQLDRYGGVAVPVADTEEMLEM